MRKGVVFLVVLQIILLIFYSPVCASARTFRLPRSLGASKSRDVLSFRNVIGRRTTIATTIASIRGGGSSDVVSGDNSIPVTNRYETVTDRSTVLYNQTSVEIGSMDTSSLLHQLSTSVAEGLTSQEASSRLKHYGPNVLDTPPSKSLLMLILEQFDDRLVQILLCVAVISGIFSFMEMRSHSLETGESQSLLKSFMEPIVILAILFLNAAVGVWQSRQAEGSLEALKKLQPSLTCVLRDGKWVDNMDAQVLVPGDIIRIRVGDKVPADARVLSLESSVLNLDEGSLTGESVTVEKLPGDEGLCSHGAPVQDMRSMLFSGTVCTAGSALAVVARTGMATEMGKIQKGVTEARADEHKTPLGIKLDEFGNQLTKIIGFICFGVWLVSIPKFNDPTFKSPLEGAVYYAKVAVALGVAAIPEGLPAVITLCLSLGTRRMAKRNVIVRKLPSVETLGCTR
jgi:Ca2+-transporting ATPase